MFVLEENLAAVELHYSVATLTGDLNHEDLPQLRAALKGLLLEAGAVVLDVSRVTVRHVATVSALPDALMAVGGWPTGRFIVVGADARLTAALHATGAGRDVLTVDDLSLATLQLHDRPERVSRRLHLPPRPIAARKARIFVRRAGVDWNVERRLDDMQAITSTLVSNAVSHARTPSSLTISMDCEGIRIRLRDFSTRQLSTHDEEKGSSSATGLSVLARLSHSWGVTPSSDGKTVWSLLPTT